MYVDAPTREASGKASVLTVLTYRERQLVFGDERADGVDARVDENRLRDLENWKTRTGAYWAFVSAVVGLGASLGFILVRSLIS